MLDTQPDIIFDDGSDMTTVLHKERSDQAIVGGLEETTTGVIRLRPWPRTGCCGPGRRGQRLGDQASVRQPARHGPVSLDGILRATNILYAGRTVVVAGYGDCGWGIAERAKGMGADTVVVEIDPVRAVAAAMNGHRVMTSHEAAAVGDVFITATGNIHVFREEHFMEMKDGAILANAGHFDVEIDLVALDRLASAKRRLRDNLDEYTLEDGRRVLSSQRAGWSTSVRPRGIPPTDGHVLRRPGPGGRVAAGDCR